MSSQTLQITETKGVFGQHPLAAFVLAFVVGFSTGGAAMTACAQDSALVRPELPRSAETTARTTPLPAPAASEYLINPDDVLDVYVYDVPELSREYTVSGAGTITIPLLPKPVQCVGMTVDQVAHSLEDNFRQTGRLSHPNVTVTIKESRSSLVTVEGAVKSPQVVPVRGPSKLISVISQCGGRADDAGSTLTVTRGELALHDLAQEGVPTTPTTTIEFKRLLDPNDPTSKSLVWPGDRVSVEHAGLFYILGQVGHPGGYNLKTAGEQVSVLQALALAGDATALAKVDKTMILRKNPKAPNGREEIALNLKDILDGRSPDRMLEADDIMYVPVSGGKRAVREIGNMGRVIVTGTADAMIYTRF